MENLVQKLSVKEKIGYALGDTASNLFFQTFIYFLLYFYTDVFGIPASVAGTMFLITRIWDAVNDPIMGAIADRTNSKWGKFRPYLLWVALPFAVMGVLTFTTPDFDSTGKLIYAYTTYTLLMMLYTAFNVPYSALMGVMTSNSMERTELSSFRFVGAFLGALIVQTFTLAMVKYFGDGDETLGWQLAMSVISGLAFILIFVTFVTTKERVLPPKDQQTNFKLDVKDLLTNKPWLLIATATIFQLTYIVMRGTTTTYYFKYYVGEQQLDLLGFVYNLSIESFQGSFLFISTLSTILGAILTKLISKKIDKKNTYLGFLIASAVFSVFFIFIDPENVLTMYIVNIILSFFFGPVSVLQWAMYTDTADYSEWKNGRRATGLVMAASLFALKLGLTFGGSIVGWLLDFYNYVPNVAQTPEALNGIVYLFSIYPAVFGILGGLIMIAYPLTNKRMEEIEIDLTARRK